MNRNTFAAQLKKLKHLTARTKRLLHVIYRYSRRSAARVLRWFKSHPDGSTFAAIAALLTGILASLSLAGKICVLAILAGAMTITHYLKRIDLKGTFIK